MKTIPIIQHADKNASKRDYDALDGRLLVSSIFKTLQGEGPYVGRPAVFLRLAGCNYGSKTDYCHFCDTSFEVAKGFSLYPDEVIALMTNIMGYRPTDILVITGGEPTLQHDLLAVISKVLVSGLFSAVQIETNGTQPKFFAEAVDQDIARRIDWVVSPKANMRLGKYPNIADSVLWSAQHFKFVVSADPNNPHHTIPEWALAVSDNKTVWVSPMTVYRKAYDGEVSSVWDAELVDQKATAANYAYAAQYALAHNLRLSVQVHTLTAIA
jgi:organic radical activating enzyme